MEIQTLEAELEQLEAEYKRANEEVEIMFTMNSKDLTPGAFRERSRAAKILGNEVIAKYRRLRELEKAHRAELN